jgi:hypothetical protein
MSRRVDQIDATDEVHGGTKFRYRIQERLQACHHRDGKEQSTHAHTDRCGQSVQP